MGVGWPRQNGSFGDLFGSIDWSGFERIFLQFLNGVSGYERVIWVVLASPQPWWCRNFSSNEDSMRGLFSPPLHPRNRTVKILSYIGHTGKGVL